MRRGWLTRQSSTSIEVLSQNSKQNTYPQATSFNAQGSKLDLELERTQREEDVRGQQKQEAKDVPQGVKVVLGGTKRDLELERAWREEEERRRREREARKLQQEGKVIIACIECGQKLRVSNAPYLHVRCPKCSCRFYWENK